MRLLVSPIEFGLDDSFYGPPSCCDRRRFGRRRRNRATPTIGPPGADDVDPEGIAREGKFGRFVAPDPRPCVSPASRSGGGVRPSDTRRRRSRQRRVETTLVLDGTGMYAGAYSPAPLDLDNQIDRHRRLCELGQSRFDRPTTTMRGSSSAAYWWAGSFEIDGTTFRIELDAAFGEPVGALRTKLDPTCTDESVIFQEHGWIALRRAVGVEDTVGPPPCSPPQVRPRPESSIPSPTSTTSGAVWSRDCIRIRTIRFATPRPIWDG